jgi:autotransporter-associated beta strand protein
MKRFSVLIAYFLLSGNLEAGFFNWTGAISSSMNNSGNWQPMMTPMTGQNDNLNFGGFATSYTVFNDIPSYSLQNANIMPPSSGSYNISGNFTFVQNGSIGYFSSSNLGTTFSNGITIAAPAFPGGFSFSVNSSGSGTGALTLGSIMESPPMAGGGVNFSGGGGSSPKIVLGFNSYTGITQLSNGVTVSCTNFSALGTSALTLNNGTLLLTGTGSSSSSQTWSSFQGTLSIGSGLTVTKTGSFSGSGFTASGPGILVLQTAASVSSNFTVSNSGILHIDAGGSTSQAILTVNSGCSVVVEDAAGAQSFQGISGAGTIQSDQNLSIGGLSSPSSTTFSGVITGAANITKDRVGYTLNLTGTSNNYTGTTSVIAGELGIVSDASIGSIQAVSIQGPDGNTSALTYNASGSYTSNLSLSIDTVTNSSPGAGVGVGSGGIVTLSNAVGESVSPSNFIKTGAGTLIFAVAPNYTGSTTISEGALQGSLTTIPTNVIDNSELIFNLPSDGALASRTISGSGALTITGAHTLTINSSATLGYTGGTNITGNATVTFGSGVELPSTGPISVDSGSTLNITGSAPAQTFASLVDGTGGGGSVILGADLTLGDATSFSFSGAISGAGGLTKQGTGTFTLGGNNTYDGGTSIADGTISFDGGGNLPLDGAVDIGADGTLDISAAGGVQTIGVLSGSGAVTLEDDLTIDFDTISSTFSGTISDGAMGFGITKDGTGTLSLTGTSDYTGDTVISAGTLIVIQNTLPGDASNDGTLQLNVSSTWDFPGQISGGGNVIIEGGGLLIFNNEQTYIGSTTINNGTLRVNGSIDSAVIINGSGILQGSQNLPSFPALINGDITINSGGVLSPGASVGTIHVNGSVAFNAGSLFTVEVDPTSGTADLLLVTGVNSLVSIDPTAIFDLRPDPGVYPSIASYLIIDASGSTAPVPINGTFMVIQNSYPLFSPQFVYTPTTLSLILNVASISSLVGSGNGAAAAACLSSVIPAVGSDLATVIGELTVTTSAADLNNTLNELQPSQFTSFSLIQQELSMQISSVINEKSQKLYSRCYSESIPSQTIWVDALGDLSNQGNTETESGYRAQSGVGMLGYDYTGPANSSAGLCGVYSYTHFDWKQDRGHGQIQSYYGVGYASYLRSYFLGSANVIGAYNQYQGTRIMSTDLLPTRVASHSHKGFELGGNITLGIPSMYKSLMVLPFFSSDFLYLYQGQMSEHGAASLDLEVQPVSSYYFREEGGLYFQKCFRFETKSWTVALSGSYIREIRTKGEFLDAQFADIDCTFQVKGYYPSRNLFSGTFTSDILALGDRLCLSLKYSGLFGEGFNDQSLNGRISYSF